MKKVIVGTVLVAAGFMGGIKADDVHESMGAAPTPSALIGVDLIETREDIIYRVLQTPGEFQGDADLTSDEARAFATAFMRQQIDEVLERDFATWPMADATPAEDAGGKLDSGGPSDTSSATPEWEQ